MGARSDRGSTSPPDAARLRPARLRGHAGRGRAASQRWLVGHAQGGDPEDPQSRNQNIGAFLNYFEHHIGDYDADTAHLTWVEDMAYTRLLRLYYRRERPIPVDINEACRLVRATAKDQRQAIADMLREFFVLAEDGWHQGRCDAELARYMKKVEHNRSVGKLGGRPRKPETHKQPNGLPSGFAIEPEQNPPQSPVPSPQTPDTSPIEEIPSNLSVAPARQVEQPILTLVEQPIPKGPPDCPHLAMLALWAEVLPAMPQHDPEQWNGARANHLRTRWRETAVAQNWPDQAAGLLHFRRLFAYVGQSQFLTGKAPTRGDKRPFLIELEWLVKQANWAKVVEGKYHQEAATA